MGTRHAPPLAAITVLALGLPLTACSSAEQAPPQVSPSLSTSGSVDSSRAADQVASERAHLPSASATPAATRAGDLDQSVFRASMGRWKAVPGEGDEGTYQPNGSWVHALDPAQVVQGLSLQACGKSPALPQPKHVLASDYRDQRNRPAVGQALRFADAGRAKAFAGAYAALLKTCTARKNPMAVTVLSTSPQLVDRRAMLADGSAWLEVVSVQGNLVKLFAANEQDAKLTDAEVQAITKAI